MNTDIVQKSELNLGDKELFEIFPEAKAIIPNVLEERKKELKDYRNEIKKKLLHVNRRVNDEFSHWFWRYWIALTCGEKLLEIKRHVFRLEQQLNFINGAKFPKGVISRDQIQQAEARPIEQLIDQRFKKSGNTLTTLCPLHFEKTPSFCIYT